MSDSSRLQIDLASSIWSRSMGVKLIVICGLAILMTIPALFVGGLVKERTKRAAEVVREVSGHIGGQQTFLGPTLAIPYSIPTLKAANPLERGTYLVFPTKALGMVKLRTEERRRSLFKVPVFQADLSLDGTFDLTGVSGSAPPGAELDWSHAEIVVGVSDARGALADATVTVDGQSQTLAPAATAQALAIGGDEKQTLKLTLFGAKMPGVVRENGQFKVTSELRFSGAQRIAVLAYGKNTQLSMQGDWANPGFDGGFLPIRRGLSGNGFTAEWSVPFIARGVRAEGKPESMNTLDETELGVSFIEVADPYQSVNRSLKYELLFIGLVFISYFVFEVTSDKRLHPAQYILVGMAQIIFYVLLLSLAERIGFDFGFVLAGSATVLLLSANVTWVFSSRAQGARALGVFTFLYALIYLLLRLEDNALLVGGVASFSAVATAMYCTRGMDWYSPLAGRSLDERRATPEVAK